MLATGDFRWDVCADGYEWRPPTMPSTGDFVFWHEDFRWTLHARTNRLKPYAPLIDTPDLFIRVSELADNPTRDAILAFADEYGQITTPDYNTSGVPLYLWNDGLKVLREIERGWRRRPRLTPALYAMLNERLSGLHYRTPAIIFQVEPPPRGSIGKLATPVLKPTTLIGAAWTQLAFAITNAADFRVCEGCERGIVIRPGYERSTRRHCNDSCKKRAQRKRERELARKGRK